MAARSSSRLGVIRARRFVGEGDLGADLEGCGAASAEIPLEADVPDDSLGAHGAICAEAAEGSKLSALRGGGPVP
jgi:hypothetical protein